MMKNTADHQLLPELSCGLEFLYKLSLMFRHLSAEFKQPHEANHERHHVDILHCFDVNVCPVKEGVVTFCAASL